MNTAPPPVAKPHCPIGAARNTRSTSSVLPILTIGAAWLAFVYIVLRIVPDRYELAMLVSIGTALLIPIVVLILRDELDIFEPLIFANLALGSMFIGRPLYDISTGNWLHSWFSTFFDTRPGFDSMLFYALLGIAALDRKSVV